jgi:flagellar motor component MotA
VSRKGIFPGWWVVAGAFLCTLTGFAVAYSFAAFAITMLAPEPAQWLAKQKVVH